MGSRRRQLFRVRQCVRAYRVGGPTSADPHGTNPAARRLPGGARAPFFRSGATDGDGSEGYHLADLVHSWTPDWQRAPAATDKAVQVPVYIKIGRASCRERV